MTDQQAKQRLIDIALKLRDDAQAGDSTAEFLIERTRQQIALLRAELERAQREAKQ